MWDLDRFFREKDDPSQIPRPNDAQLDRIEDFLAFSVDSAVVPMINPIISLIINEMSNFFRDGNDISEESDQKLLRYIKMLRFIRPILLNEQNSKDIDEIIMKFIQNTTGKIQHLSYIIAIDHIAAKPNTHHDFVLDLIQWTTNALQQILKQEVEMDYDFIRTMVQALRPLVLSDSRTIRYHFSIFGTLLEITIFYLNLRSSDNFFTHFEFIITKSLRLIYYLLKKFKIDALNEEILANLTKIQKIIPDDVRFMHIYENYLLILCGITRFVEKDKPQELVIHLITVITENIRYFLYPPFNRSKKVRKFIKTLSFWLSNTKQSVNNVQLVLPGIWSMVTTFQNHSIEDACMIIKSFKPANLIKTTPFLFYELLEQIISCFQIMFIDFNSIDPNNVINNFESETWLKSNMSLMNLFAYMIESETIEKCTPTLLSVLKRLSNYISFLLDFSGSITTGQNHIFSSLIFSRMQSRQFKEQIIQILNTFCKSLSFFGGNIFLTILTNNMLDFLPSKPHHIFHQNIHSNFIKMQSLSNAYFQAFFYIINHEFETVFLPNPHPSMLILIRKVFERAFLNPKSVQMKEKDAEILARNAYQFTIKALIAKNTMLIELLLMIFHSIFQFNGKTNLFDTYMNMLKNPSFPIPPILKILSEDKDLEVLVSLLTLFLFHFFQNPDTRTEDWSSLFVSSLESDIHLQTAMHTLYKLTSRTFPEWTSSISKTLQVKLVTSLASSLKKLHGQEISYPRILLGRIPDIASKLSLYLFNTNKAHDIFSIDGIDYSVDVFFNTIKKYEDPQDSDLEILFQVFKQLIEKKHFHDIVIDKKINPIFNYLSMKCESMINEIEIRNLKISSRNAVAFLKHKFLRESSDLINEVKNHEDFVRDCFSLCNNKDTVETSISIIDILFKYIDNPSTIKHANNALIQAAQYEYDFALAVMTTNILQKEYDTPELQRLVRELFSQYESYVVMYDKKIRKISMHCMQYLEENFNIKSGIDNCVQTLQGLQQRISQHYFCPRMEFLFLHKYDQLKNTESIIQSIIPLISSQAFIAIPPEILKFYSSNMYQETITFNYSTVHFLFHVLAKLFPYLPDNKQGQNYWENVFKMLREEKFRSLLPKFIKWVEKENVCPIPSIPKEINTIIGTQSKYIFQPFKYEETVELRFLYQYGESKQTKDIAIFIEIGLKALLVPETTNIHELSKELLKMIFILSKKDETYDLKHLCSIVMEVSLSAITMKYPIEIPIQDFVENFSVIAIDYVVTSLKRSWNMDLYIYILKLIRQSSIVKFRSKFFELMALKHSIVFTFCEKFIRMENYQFEFILSSFSSTCAAIINKAFITSEEFINLLTFCIELLIFLKNVETKALKYNPTIFLGFTEIFLPIKFVNLFTEESNILQIYIQRVIPLILKSPQVFHHPVFKHQCNTFMRLVSENVRNQIFDSIKSFFPATLDERRFVLQFILNQRKYFDISEEKIKITGNFLNFENPSIFSKYLLHYALETLGFQNNVKIIDIDKDPLVQSSYHAQALMILYKKSPYDVLLTNNRLFQAGKIIAITNPEKLDGEKLSELMLSHLEFTPFSFSSALVSFRMIGQFHRIFDFSDRKLLHFILTYSSYSTASSAMPQKKSMAYIPYAFKMISNNNVTNDRVFEILLTNVISIIKQDDQQKFSFGQLLLTLMNQMVNNIDHMLTSTSLIIELKDALLKNKPDNSSGLKLYYMLITCLSQHLFSLPDFFPPVLKPIVLFITPLNRDLLNLYKSTLQSIMKHGNGVKITRRIVNEAYPLISKELPTLKLDNDQMPLTIVSNWINQVPTNHRLYQNVIGLFESIQPIQIDHLFASLLNMKDEIKIRTYFLIRNMIYSDFTQYIKIIATIPNMYPIFASHSTDIVADCWKTKWLAIHPKNHILVFLRFILPENSLKLMQSFTQKDIIESATLAIRSITYHEGFERFYRYYITVCPESSLAKCFWASPAFSNSIPMPHLSLLDNITYLNQKFFCEDALGLLKTKYPDFSEAITFHQLCHYNPAKYYYMKHMNQNPDSYFLGLLQLRNISFIVSLPQTPDFLDKIFDVQQKCNYPRVILPFLLNYSDQTDINRLMNMTDFDEENYTTFFSQTYLPFILKASIIEEVYSSLKALKQCTVRTEPALQKMLKPWCNIWMKSFDKMNAMSSILTWRLNILPEFLKNPDLCSSNLSSIIKDAISKNRASLSRLMQKSGFLGIALKQIQNSTTQVTHSIFFSLNKWNLPWIINFIKTARQNSNMMLSYQTMRLNIFNFLFDFKKSFALISTGTTSNKQFISTFIKIYTKFPKLIDPQVCFPKIMFEINSAVGERTGFYIALALGLVKKNPSFVRFFNMSILNCSKDEMNNTWLRWLPQIFRIIGEPSVDFLFRLYKHHPTHFLMSVNHTKNCKLAKNPAFIDELVVKIKSKKEGRSIIEFQYAFSCINKCKNDIIQLNTDAKAHLSLYESLSKNQLITDVENVTTIEQLADYCVAHPPVFKPSMTFTGYASATGFNFPTVSNSIIDVSLVKYEKEEAELRLTTVKGETKCYMLVSPLIYKFSHAEHMFLLGIQRIIDSHQSSRSRSHFINYPYVFMLDPSLLLVHTAPMYSQTGLTDSLLPKLLTKAAIDMENDDLSPVANRERRNIDIDRNYILDFYLKDCEGSKIDFFFTRQSFASHFAAFSVLRFLFMAQLPSIPSLCLFGDRLKICIPDFFHFEEDLPQIPFTPAIRRFVPEYLMRGTFTTTWHAIAESISTHSEKVLIYLQTLAPDGVNNKFFDSFSHRADKMAHNAREETGKTDTIFPFILLDHLIETSQNSLDSQPYPYSWI